MKKTIDIKSCVECNHTVADLKCYCNFNDNKKLIDSEIIEAPYVIPSWCPLKDSGEKI